MSSCSKRNILFVVPSLRTGGAETQLVSLVNTIDSERFQKYLFSFDAGLDLRTRLETDVEFVHHLRQRKLDLDVVRALAKVIDGRSIDVVHCTLQFALLIGRLAIARSKRKPALIIAVHTTLNRCKKDDLLDRILYQPLMRGCDKVVFVCEAQREHWLKKCPALEKNAVVVHNGIDSRYFSSDLMINRATEFRARFGIPSDVPLACAIAQFRPEKGHKNLIEAFSKTGRVLPDAHLALAGTGRTRAEIEQRVRQLGLQGRVHFLGNLKDVRPLLAVSNVAVLGSAAETFSIAMLEALAMGVPVVATDVGGTKEAVRHHKTGLLVPPNDVQGLASALQRMLGNPALARKLGTSGKHLVSEKFDRRAMAQKTEIILEEVLAAARSRPTTVPL